jgi:hypothetical protein
MRAMAGHPKEKGLFSLGGRGTVIPTEELQNTIFPFISKYEGKTLGPTATNFLLLLKKMRTILLQDMVAISLTTRNHIAFQMEPFRSDMFSKFCDQVSLSITNYREPQVDLVHRLAPGVSMRLDLIDQKVESLAKEHYMAREIAKDERAEMASTLVSAQANFTHQMQSLFNHMGNFKWGELPGVGGTRTEIIMQQEKDIERKHVLLPNVTSITQLYSYWNGTHEFDITNCPAGIVGGIRGKEQEINSHRWRSHFTQAEKKRFSRFKTIIKSLDSKILQSGNDVSTVLAAFDRSFIESRKSISGFAETMKNFDPAVLISSPKIGTINPVAVVSTPLNEDDELAILDEKVSTAVIVDKSKFVKFTYVKMNTEWNLLGSSCSSLTGCFLNQEEKAYILGKMNEKMT